MKKLKHDAALIAREFNLPPYRLMAERTNARGHYGVCYEDGLIRIRLRHVHTGRLLKYSSLITTLCHELAHLRHFNHGDAFQRLNAQMLAWARSQGIYIPNQSFLQRLRPGRIFVGRSSSASQTVASPKAPTNESSGFPAGLTKNGPPPIPKEQMLKRIREFIASMK